jgi:hypothetical protein
MPARDGDDTRPVARAKARDLGRPGEPRSNDADANSIFSRQLHALAFRLLEGVAKEMVSRFTQQAGAII